jgi:hypothetical protein
MFDYVVQIREGFIHNIFNELRRTGRPFLQDTLDQAPPLVIGPMVLQPILNLPDADIPVSLVAEDQIIELGLNSVPLQLNVQNLPNIGDLLIEGVVSILLRFPIQSGIANGIVRAGFDTASLVSANVLVNLDTGHPLEDDELVLELLNRMVQNLYGSGLIPMTREYTGESPIQGTTVDAFVRFVNDVGEEDSRRARVEPSPQVGRVRITLPLEVWANTVDSNQTILEHLEFDADVHIDVPFIIDLLPNDGEQATMQLHLPDGEPSLTYGEIREGEEALDNPITAAAIEAFLQNEGVDVLADLGVQQIDVFTLGELEELLRTLVLDTLTNSQRFIQFWQAPQSEEVSDVVARIIDGIGEGILAIGVNAGVGANLFSEEAMIPAGRAFAIRLNAEAVIEDLNANLIAPAEYDDVDGDLVPLTLAAEGASEITVTGFDESGGTFRRNTRFRLRGFIYTVNADADIVTNDGDDIVADLSITPDLRTTVGALNSNDSITVLFGVGLPRTEDAGGNDRTFRINDDMSATFHDGSIRLEGTGRLRRPNALFFRNIDTTIGLSLGLDWASTARINGGGQTGESLSVDLLTETLREFPDNSLVVIDGEDEPRRLTNASAVEGSSATLELSPAIDEAHGDDTMLSLRWLRIGRVSGDEQVGNTLQIADMSFGEGFIPGGTRIRVDDEVFAIENDVDIGPGGEVTVTLTQALSTEFDDGPPDGEAVRLFGGWDGRAVVDGSDQTGQSLQLSEVVRTVPRNTTLTIAGMPGLFTVASTAEIVDNETTLSLNHAALEQLGGLIVVDTDELWDRIGQPQEGVSVRRRYGAQAPDLRLIGEPDVEPHIDLGDLLGSIVGAIVGVIVSLVTGGGLLIAVVAGVVAGFITRAIADRIIGNVANEEAENALDLVDIPFPDQLSDLGVAVDAIFNNPIEITPDGLNVAGRAVATSVFPDLAESNADANGPYEFRAGIAGNFAGGTFAPLTTYAWRTGDGAELAGLAPAYTYPRQGTYVADLSSVDNQLGLDVQTRQLATVVVKNTRPVGSTIPFIEGLEGEEVEVEMSFTDVAWLDSHHAVVDWGDGTLPTVAEVAEVTGPPQTTGTVTARHTYCDNGVYIVTIILSDDPGGEARVITEAHIENVPPVVDAGPDVFAHPCVPTRLIGRFTDQGWCDTHTGIWDFGDCSPVLDAFIEETHEPPEARGTAVAAHCYSKCGTYVATLTITDDDAASTSDSLVVRCSDLMNGSFEAGFERQRHGQVGRHWRGYHEPLSIDVATESVFDCEMCVVCNGQRAQAVNGFGLEYAGILQQIGVNPGWEYQVSAMVNVITRSASIWLGIDPNGGTDRTADAIVWRQVGGAEGWRPIATRAVAESDRLTVFIELRQGANDPALFDCIELQAYPCVPADESEDKPEDTPPPKKCIDWAHSQTGMLAPSAMFGDWQFRSVSGEALRIVTFGQPNGQPKLSIPDRPDGLEVLFNDDQQSVTVRVGGPSASLLTMTALSLGGGVLGVDQSASGNERLLTVTAPGIASIRIESDIRGTLIELCAVPSTSRLPVGPPEFTTRPVLPRPG